ncbi:MAG: hypothetical protein R3F24_04110 [Gammaproteobacteria bacterium]
MAESYTTKALYASFLPALTGYPAGTMQASLFDGIIIGLTTCEITREIHNDVVAEQVT